MQAYIICEPINLDITTRQKKGIGLTKPKIPQRGKRSKTTRLDATKKYSTQEY